MTPKIRPKTTPPCIGGNVSQFIGRIRPRPGPATTLLGGSFVDLDQLHKIEVEVVDVKQKRKIGTYSLDELLHKMR